MDTVVVEITKQCLNCHLVKPLGDFGISTYMHDGRNNKCMICMREYTRLYRATNRKRLADYHKNWCKQNKESRATSAKKYIRKHPEVARRAASKRRAIRRFLPHSPITQEQEELLKASKMRIFYGGGFSYERTDEGL